MQAERVLLETDGQGNLIEVPKLPPHTRLEAIFLVLEDKMPEQKRCPPTRLKGTVKATTCSSTPFDPFESAMSDEEWESSLDRTARQISGDSEAFK
ncbi:MAG: hypothetical protein R6U68_15065 [Desulfobacteraceae bacterium]